MNHRSSNHRVSLLRQRTAAGLILMVALALRLYGLDQHVIWWDEGLSAWAARLPVPRLIDWTAHDVHPPLHFLIQRGWWLLSGDGDWIMRFISALAGTATVAAIYALARSLGGRRAGEMAAVFAAVSVFAITWSQELRMYVWAGLWASLLLAATVHLWRTEEARWWILYVLAAAAGLWTLYLFVTVLLVTNVAFLVAWWRSGRPRPRLVRWMVAQLATLALFIPWLAYALPRMMSWSSAEPFSPGLFVRLYLTVLATGAAENIDRWLIATAVVMLVAIGATASVVRRRKSATETAGLTLLLLGILLPAAMVYVLTALPGRRFYVPRLAPRYFLPLAGTFYALLGWGLAEVSRRSRGLALLGCAAVVAVALAGAAALLPGRTSTDQYASLVATLEAHRHDGDAVLLYPDEDWPLFAARHAGEWHKVPAGMHLTPENVEALLAPVWEGGDGLWVVATPKAQQTDSRGLVRSWLDQRAAAHAAWEFDDTRLTLYARTTDRAEATFDVAPGRPESGATFAAFGGGEVHAAPLPLRRYRIGDTLFVTIYWRKPPSGEIQLGLAGRAAPVATLPELPPVMQGPQRIVARLRLTSDLVAGRHSVVLRAESGNELMVGTIDLVAAARAWSDDVRLDRPVDVRFGDQIRLRGYDLASERVQAGDALILTLYWQADQPIAERYKVFTHLVGSVWNADEGNFLWGQQDNEPQSDQLPTTRWLPGEIVVDRYRIEVSPAAPAGQYEVEVGLYGLLDGRRLSYSDGRAEGDALILGSIEVR